jgi:glucose/arabinose dehydrogenase
MGDGGSGGDPSCFAQTPGSLLGKMLRLDVRQNLNQPPFYGIPASNPYVGAGDPGGLIPDEIWAFGLRNPWRFSFDRATDDLFIADVGQDAFEEIDLHPAASPGGANYGWKVMEGSSCFSTDACPTGTPACNSPQLTPPIHTYGHGTGDCSITGGYVYRGGAAPELSGKYLFADYCSGQVRTLTKVGAAWQSQPLLAAGGNVTSFGEDSDGGVYLTVGDGVFVLVSPGRAVPALGGTGLVVMAAALLLGALAARRRA